MARMASPTSTVIVQHFGKRDHRQIRVGRLSVLRRRVRRRGALAGTGFGNVQVAREVVTRDQKLRELFVRRLDSDHLVGRRIEEHAGRHRSACRKGSSAASYRSETVTHCSGRSSATYKALSALDARGPPRSARS